ncbi:tRNA lysidine(34) synthetase TilS [Granulicoccus sp. GXG6511]|uniref:tRNA lysidine(34) synthetase TilS n=1 Tax=Granulicoccus sp. GXG6511 TaxID=3381351 RepID=UPI003D7DF52D
MAKKALGPAMAQLVAAVEHALDDSVRGLIVGCSGGADSLALVAATAIVAKRRSAPARAIVIDHGLQEDSAAVAKKAASRAERVGLPADIVEVTVVPDGTGPEASARTARHAALGEVADALDATVLLGHTLDDQAETVLLGLARGSGARSLSGMAPARDRFVRPFLGIRREVTEAACTELDTKFWRDPHNDDLEFARVRVRKKIMPMLEAELGPGIAEALARTAVMLRDDTQVLDRLAEEAVSAEGLAGALAVSVIPREPALRRRVLRRWLLAHGAAEPAYAHVKAVEALVTDWRGQKWVEVPGLRVSRSADRLLVMRD